MRNQSYTRKMKLINDVVNDEVKFKLSCLTAEI